MTIGYPDYARLSQQGGTQLYDSSGSIPQGTQLFQGYVGAWPYVNLSSNGNAGTDVARIILIWYSDETFNTQVGFRYAIRYGNSLAQTQYANLSPWLYFYYTSESGNPMNWYHLGLYGTTGPAGQSQLASVDVPIYSSSDSIAAGTTNKYYPQHIQPGNASLAVSTAAASWYINFYYYGYADNNWDFDGQINSSWAGKGGSWDFPMLDAPYQISVHNGDASAQTINWTWKSV